MTMRLLLVAIISVSFGSCAVLSQLLKGAFQQPGFGFKRLGLDNVDLGGLTLDTVWQLDNPNPVGISLADVDYALFVEDKQVVAGAPPLGLTVAPKGSTELHFPAGIKFQELAQVVEVFLTKDTATYRAEGHLGVKTPVGVLRLPLGTSGNFEVPKLPQLAFGNPRVTNLSLSGATIEFPLTVTNRNGFPLPVGNVTGALNIAGSNVGSLSTGNLGDLTAKGTRQVTLPLSISFMSAAGAVVNAVRGGNAAVRLDANVQSGQMTLPLNHQQVVSFVR